MKKTLIIFITSLISLIASVNLYSHTPAKKYPYFYGTVRLNNKMTSQYDSITIKYKHPYAIDGENYENIRIVSDKNGKFEFMLPKFTEPCKMLILVRRSKGEGYNKLGEGYFVNPDDFVKIEILKEQGKASFSGKGSDKYNVACELETIDHKFLEGRAKLLRSTNKLFSRLTLFDSLVRVLNFNKNRIISNSRLDPKMKTMFMYEYSRLFLDWNLFMYSNWIFYKNDQEMRSIIRQHFSKNKERFILQSSPQMALCPVYLQLLADCEARSMFIQGGGDFVKIQSFYNLIKTKYTGTVREILIGNFVTANRGVIPEMRFTTSKFDSLSRDALKLIKNSSIKKAIAERIKFTSGEPILNTSFVDLNGNLISLASLRNKVVLIDLWNVGCSWCAIFHNYFKKNVYPLIKDNKDFVYLSVGTDRTTERWKKGIESGLYTDKNYLNVSLGEIGFNHPFIKHYNISALPFALLVDRTGSIYSNQILRQDQTLTLIKEALGQDSISQVNQKLK